MEEEWLENSMQSFLKRGDEEARKGGRKGSELATERMGRADEQGGMKRGWTVEVVRADDGETK